MLAHIGVDPDSDTYTFGAVDREARIVQVAKRKIIRPEKDVLKDSDRLRDIISRGHGALSSFCELVAHRGFSIGSITVEAQEVSYTARSGANPRDIVKLATIAGALLMEAETVADKWDCPIFFPAPSRWKGSVVKTISHARIFHRAKVPCKIYGSKSRGYAVPVDPSVVPGADQVNRGDWMHLTDSVGLAHYGLDEFFKIESKRK